MFKFWRYDDSRKQYSGTQEVLESLPSGMYTINLNNWGEPQAQHRDLRTDDLLTFQNGPMIPVLEEIKRFWDSKDKYKRLGVAHKRGVLFHGPHGCGKTAIVSKIIQHTIAHNGLVFDVEDPEHFQDAIPLLRQIEKERPIVSIFEDIEQMADYDEETMLEIMDGSSSLGDNILFIATTNKLDKVPPRIKCRPSRIDTLIEVGLPEPVQRLEYLRFLGIKFEFVPPDGWADITDGFSLAQLKELIIAMVIYDKKLEESVERLKQLNPPAKCREVPDNECP